MLAGESPVPHAVDDCVRVILWLLPEGTPQGKWAANASLYETATILNGSVNHVIITWLICRKPRDFMKTTNSILGRLIKALLPPPAGRHHSPLPP